MGNRSVHHKVTLPESQLVGLLLNQSPQNVTSDEGTHISINKASVLITEHDPDIHHTVYHIGFCNITVQFKTYLGKMKLVKKDDTIYVGEVIYEE